MSAPDAGPPASLLTQWARLLVGSLQRAGLRDVVLSPGSRSTPFTAAVLADPGLRSRTLIDERSAAFYALGHARITGDPVLLVCTSGTAGANYFPALVEAAEAGVPLLVLTADRPLELQHAAAPQTIDQVKLFGDVPRAFFELGTPDADPRALRALPRVAAQALAASRGPVPGPVHLNARARKPLEPVHGDSPEDEALRDTVDRLLDAVPAFSAPVRSPDADALDRLADACRSARRGLIVCGPAHGPVAADPADVAALAGATGFPVVAEAASQIRFADGAPDLLDAFPALLELPGFADGHAPDLVLQVGRPPTASAWHRALDGWADTRRWVLAEHGWPDPWSTATGLVHGPLGATVRALAERVGDGEAAVPSEARREWREALASLNGRARSLIEGSIASGDADGDEDGDEDGDGPAWSEGAAVRAVVEGLEPGSVLALGNSLPIREVDTFVPAEPRGLEVWFQRGANGIDGLVSGAAGAAAAAARPTTLILGDVSLAHDLGGLATLRGLPAPLTVVVLNNGGGRIFERLPVADALAGDPALDAWLTPPDVDFQAAAAAYGLPCARARTLAELRDAQASLRSSGGVLEVVVDEDGTTGHQRSLRRRLEEAGLGT